MSWVERYLRHPQGVTALLLLGVIFGLLSFQRLPLNLFPDANYPRVAVLLIWPGASADDMAEKISRPVEKELAAIGGNRKITAVVRDETAAVTAEFAYDKGLDAAVTDVNTALNRILPDLPPKMLPPRIFRISDAIQPVQTLAVSARADSGLRLPQVRQICDNELQEALLRIPGIADVEIFGGYQPEIRLALDRDRLAARNLSGEQVLTAVAAEHRNIPTGRLIRKQDELLLTIAGEKPFRHQLGDIVVGSGPDGAIYLRDIADIRTGHAERRSFYRGNGRPAIALNLLRAENGHVTTTLAAIEKALPAIRDRFPHLQFEVADTQGDLIRTSVSNLTTSLRDAVFLTVVVIFFMLARVRLTLLAAVSIPVTFLLTFAGMRLLNYELNIVTMTAIILAVGLLVDDAIVVIENIDRHALSGEKTAFQAAVDGTREIFLADLAGTVTTLSVLVPIMFVGGYAEKILRPLTVVLSLALLASYAVSVTVIPLLAAKLMKAGQTISPNRLEQALTRLLDFWITPLQRALVRIFRLAVSKWGFLLIPLLLLLLPLSLRQLPLAGRDLMPAMDTGIVKVSFQTWPNSTLTETEAVVSQMEAYLQDQAELVRLSTVVGAEPNVISFDAERTPQEGIMTVHFQNRFQRSQTIWEMEAEMLAAFSKISGLQSVDVYDYGATPLSSIAAPVDVMVSGPDPRMLDRLAAEVQKRLQTVKGLRSVSRSWHWAKREVAVHLDESRLLDYGLTPLDVSRILRTATTGEVAATFRVPGQDGYPLRLRFDPQTMQSLSDVSTLQISGPRGPVPLNAVAELVPRWRQSRITRQNLQPTVNIRGYRGKTAISHLHQGVKAALAGLELPAGYRLTYEGEIKHMQATFGNLGQALVLALLLLFFSLTVTFKSYIHPVIIMSAIPLAFIGVPWGMLLMDRHFCMPAAMGMILLSGIVVNNTILLVDFIETEKKAGTSLITAVEKAIGRRTRPILMTAFSTTAGMLPIAAEMAIGLERLSPLAVVAIAGLLMSTVLTLAYVPAIYFIVEKIKDRWQSIYKTVEDSST